MEARMGLEPALYGGSFMGGVVVNHEMEVEALRGLLIDQPQKAQELAMPMARQASADDLAVQHVERREQSRRAVAFVVVGHRSGAPFLHRQAGLGAIESLNLALFVDAEDQRLVRRIEIEPDDIFDLGGKVLVARDFEGLDQMRLQSMRAP